MPVTNTIQGTVNWAQLFIRSAPLSGVGGVASEPALTIANWTLQYITSPPFAWRWNRNTTSIAATAGTQNYTKALSDFGWIEKATVNNGTEVYELNVKMDLGDEIVQNKPAFIAARLDDDAGNITFRVTPPPDQNYTIVVTYQKFVPLLTSLASSWSPIPDYLAYLYQGMFLAKVYEYFSDERFGLGMSSAMKALVSTNAGLDATQLSVVLGDRLDILKQQQFSLGKSNLGLQGRI